MIGAPIMITSPQKIEFLVHLPQICSIPAIRVSQFHEIQLTLINTGFWEVFFGRNEVRYFFQMKRTIFYIKDDMFSNF